MASGVSELRGYLLRHWTDDGCRLPLRQGSPLYSYDKYKLTAAEHNPTQQKRNTLRWGWGTARRLSLVTGLPGYQGVEREVWQLAVRLFPRLALGGDIHNGHILRQFYEADGGSGFCRHVDLADGVEDSTFLFLSVLVKLTDDPPGSDGSWMQVAGCEPVRYGSSAGSTIMFMSRSPHWSLRTPINMNKVLKVAFFFKFTDPQLRAAYKATVLPDTTSLRSVPPDRTLSVLPSQASQADLNRMPKKSLPQLDLKPVTRRQTAAKMGGSVAIKPEEPAATRQQRTAALPPQEEVVHGETDDETASLAESLDGLVRSAEAIDWGKHMSNCNKLLKVQLASLDEIISHCDEGSNSPEPYMP